MDWQVSSTTGSLRTNDAVVSLPVKAWGGPFAPELTTVAVSALEAGHVLMLPGLAFGPYPQDAAALACNPVNSRRKNITFDRVSGTLAGSNEQPALLAAMLHRFADQSDSLLRDLLAPYAPYLTAGPTSFRPAEIEGRTYSLRQDDRRLHVDAFPSRPVRGNRILRLFTSISPSGQPHEWRVGEPFEDLAARFIGKLSSTSRGRARLYALVGLTTGVRWPYDQMMLALHDGMMQAAEYQDNAPSMPCVFPAGTTWICFTDQVPHAVVSGHLTLEQTFHLPVEAMAEPDRSPLRVLERLTGRRLV